MKRFALILRLFSATNIISSRALRINILNRYHNTHVTKLFVIRPTKSPPQSSSILYPSIPQRTRPPCFSSSFTSCTVRPALSTRRVEGMLLLPIRHKFHGNISNKKLPLTNGPNPAHSPHPFPLPIPSRVPAFFLSLEH